MSNYETESDSQIDEKKMRVGTFQAIKLALLYQIVPFNYIQTSFFKNLFFYCLLIVNIFVFHAPIMFLYDEYEIMNRLSYLAIPVGLMFSVLLSSAYYLLGDTYGGIRTPTYAQCLFILILSLIHFPIYILISYFLPENIWVYIGYFSICSILIVIFTIRSLMAIWEYSKAKLFYIIFSVVWFVTLFCYLIRFSMILYTHIGVTVFSTLVSIFK